MNSEADELANRRHTIQSLESALHVLQKMAHHGKPITLSELSKLCDEPTSKLHRYLSTFCELDFVTQNHKHGAYSLGRSAIHLGLAAMRQVELFSRVNSGLQQLAMETGHHCFLAIRTMGGPVIVRWVYSQDPTIVNILPGQTLPITRSSAGKIFAAFLSAAQTEPFIKRELAGFTEDPEFEKLIRKRISDVLRDRYSRSKGELDSHVKSISVPIFDWHDSSLVVVGCVMSVDADDAIENESLNILKKFAEDRSLRPSMNFFASQQR